MSARVASAWRRGRRVVATLSAGAHESGYLARLLVADARFSEAFVRRRPTSRGGQCRQRHASRGPPDDRLVAACVRIVAGLYAANW